MDDNIWEYPFGDLDDDDDMFYHKPEERSASLPPPDSNQHQLPNNDHPSSRTISGYLR